MRSLALLIITLFYFVSAAEEKSFDKVTLADGRVLVGEYNAEEKKLALSMRKRSALS